MGHSRTVVAAVVCIASLLLPGAARGAEIAEKSENAATEAAESWLARVDAGDYGASWDEAAPLFRSAIEREKWGETLRAVRGPLGEVRSRSVKSAQFVTTLPGAPDGEYVVIQFETSFAHKQSAVETVTPMKAPDGAWRVSGYFIR